jgi:hypothetical protein
MWTALCRDGYVVAPNALEGALIQRLRRAFEGAAPKNGTQHVELTAETPEYASWCALRQHPVVIDAATSLLGEPSR